MGGIASWNATFIMQLTCCCLNINASEKPPGDQDERSSENNWNSKWLAGWWADSYSSILKDEEGHLDWLEAQINQISQMGIQNYLADQLG